MYNQPNQNQPRKWEAKPLFTIHYPLFTNKGMSLMEVLASMFVICIGLLGVLAVIPYGAFQVAKAKNAENTSWMLANAEYDLKAAGMAKPENWSIVTKSTNGGYDVSQALTKANGGTSIYEDYNNPSVSNRHWLDCSRYFMVDPFSGTTASDSNLHIYRIGVNFDGTLGDPRIWRERMTGQDDLVYTTHADKRTDFSGQNNKVLSSGQYTWFFMFRPDVTGTTYTNVPWGEVNDTANVDIIACFNRVPGEEKIAKLNYPTKYASFINAAQIVLQGNAEDLDLKTTKYIFISGTNGNYIEGQWHKVINATEIINNERTVFIMPDLDFSAGVTTQDLQVLIVPGVIYHKQVSAEIK